MDVINDQEKDLNTILSEARERYEYAVDAERLNLDHAIEDLDFASGEQWDNSLRSERESEGRPCITINRIPQFVKQITGDIRQNAPRIKIIPVDSQGDAKIAEIRAGIIRFIENSSNAGYVYAATAEKSTICGIGHIRVKPIENQDDIFNPDLIIEAIQNPLGVVWDPDSRSITREDANYCFVVESMTEDSFKKRFPKAVYTSWDDITKRYSTSNSISWADPTGVLVCEYWCKKPIERIIVRLQSGEILDVTDRTEQEIQSLPVIDMRRASGYKIMQYLMSGAEILQEPITWPGKYIPIVPVIGEEIFNGNKCYRHGIVRFAKDAQRMYNFFRSAEIELVQLQNKAPYLATPANVENYEGDWSQANKRALPYILFNPDPLMPGFTPQRQQPPVSSSGMSNQIALAAEDMKATTGIYDAALGKQSNETSGRAILARQSEADTSTYVYLDNLRYSIKHVGKILNDLIPIYYNAERSVRMLDVKGDISAAFVSVPIVDPNTGQIIAYENDITVGKYDVAVETGPGYTTKRQQTAEQLIQLMQTMPDVAPKIADILIGSLDINEADEIRKRLQEFYNPPPPPPNPFQEMEMASKQAEIEGAQLDNQGKSLDLLKKQAEVSAISGRLQEFINNAVLQQIGSIFNGAGINTGGAIPSTGSQGQQVIPAAGITQ